MPYAWYQRSFRSSSSAMSIPSSSSTAFEKRRARMKDSARSTRSLAVGDASSSSLAATACCPGCTASIHPCRAISRAASGCSSRRYTSESMTSSATRSALLRSRRVRFPSSRAATSNSPNCTATVGGDHTIVSSHGAIARGETQQDRPRLGAVTTPRGGDRPATKRVCAHRRWKGGGRLRQGVHCIAGAPNS